MFLTRENIRVGLKVKCIFTYSPLYMKTGIVKEILSENFYKISFDNIFYAYQFKIKDQYLFEIIDEEEQTLDSDCVCCICNAPAPHTKQLGFICVGCKILQDIKSFLKEL